MQESISGDSRRLSFYFYSDGFKEKAGFKLDAKLVKNKKLISIKLYNTPKSPPSIIPLETTVHLDSLTKGDYQMSIFFKNDTIKGRLAVNDNRYQLLLNKNPKITLANNTLNKIPFNSIFGRIHYYSPSNLNLVNEFLDSLKAIGAQPKLYNPGYYGLFTIAKAGTIEQKNDKGYFYTKNFIFQYDGNKQRLKELVKRYAFNYTTQMLITLITFDGTTYNLWNF